MNARGREMATQRPSKDLAETPSDSPNFTIEVNTRACIIKTGWQIVYSGVDSLNSFTRLCSESVSPSPPGRPRSSRFGRTDSESNPSTYGRLTSFRSDFRRFFDGSAHIFDTRPRVTLTLTLTPLYDVGRPRPLTSGDLDLQCRRPTTHRGLSM
jgi:hypothetical protein